jgi:hypothetical protein
VSWAITYCSASLIQKMSLLERHRYMISRLAEAFEYNDEDEIEKMMLEPDVLQSIDFFFTAQGPTKIVITLEPIVQKVLLTGKHSKAQPKPAEPVEAQIGLKVHMKEIEYGTASAVYFIKTRRGKDNDDHYAIDPYKINDGSLSFGIIRAPLESLEVVMRCVYKPLIQDMNTDLWGYASSEQKSEFLSSMDIFTKGLQESIRSISGGLELKKPDEKIETLGSIAAGDPALVISSLNLLQEWCNRIQKYLDDTDRSRWETQDSGPDTEVDYWRSRMQR